MRCITPYLGMVAILWCSVSSLLKYAHTHTHPPFFHYMGSFSLASSSTSYNGASILATLRNSKSLAKLGIANLEADFKWRKKSHLVRLGTQLVLFWCFEFFCPVTAQKSFRHYLLVVTISMIQGGHSPKCLIILCIINQLLHSEAVHKIYNLWYMSKSCCQY